MRYELILVNKTVAPYVAHVQLHRPDALNALNAPLMAELKQALAELDGDDEVRCIVLSGNERAFAAGADIKQMADKGAIDMLRIDLIATWDQIRKIKKPLVAAVSGFALGGGCELMMICDMVIASDTAQFGQPEIKLGTLPGAGGTQRLTRAVGKVKAMEMVLTGRFIGAEEALRWGLINKVVPVELYLTEAIKIAAEIAQLSPIALELAKEAVNQAFELNLTEGLKFERKNFYMSFATEDQKEGMAAFMEKRKATFIGR